MKLTKDQIENLYQFSQKHYVEWYDLQTELVDHLANSIEAQWQQNPKLSFEDALQLEFKKFGVCGFMDVVEERQVSLNKKYNKLVWSHFKGFFTLPKIIGTLAAFSALILLMLRFQFAHVIIVSVFIISGLIFLVGMIKLSRKNKKQTKISGKKWLYNDIIHGFGAFGVLMFIPIQIAFQLADNSQFNPIFAVFISSTLVSVLLFGYIILVIIPSKAEQYLKETYPEYELANKV